MDYYSPSELKRLVDDTVAIYNSTPHELLSNVSLDEVYVGRRGVVLQHRKEKNA
jgi:hypothetical protein